MLTGIWALRLAGIFVAWGVYYGILLLLEKFVFGRWLEKAPGLFRHIYCMFFVMLGWNLFVFAKTSEAGSLV